MGIYFHDAVGFPFEGCDRKGVGMKYCVVNYEECLVVGRAHGPLVESDCPDFPIMDNMLTKNTLQVVCVNLGSGTYISSKLLSMGQTLPKLYKESEMRGK
eukprot:1156370-Pelagomonas_calceolata.AAC.1